MQHTYLNPVYAHNFPDPFVLKYCGEYWAYGTGTWRDGRWFGILRSRDLAVWEEIGGALEPLPGAWPCQWAPEVSYHNGSFYLYYSIGDEATMQIRVAISHSPAGPFVDSGRRLSHEEFAIDAHIFVDDDGARHLFYATDYLTHSHIGTGTARVRLADPLTPVGEPFPVTRPRYDRQLYDPQRPEKGGVRWHTIEGSFVLKRKGRYYQMFSGGNWQNLSYGVSYALTDRLDATEEWSQVADGERVVPILRTVSGQVIGPGHNSVVRGPNNQELLCVYHRWDAEASSRVMALDRLDWAGERMLLLGPTTTPQPVYSPSCADFFDGERVDGLGPDWSCTGGSWIVSAGEATQQSLEPAAARYSYGAEHYTAEVSVRALHSEGDGAYGVDLGDQARFLIQSSGGRALAQIRRGDGWATTELLLPADFNTQAYHLVRIELSAGRLVVALDEAAARWETRLASGALLPIALVSEGVAAAFAGFALTEGWSDLFWPGQAAPAAWGWRGAGDWHIADGTLATSGGATIFKGPLPAVYELVVNARADDTGARYGFYPAACSDDPGPLVALEQSTDGCALRVYSGDHSWSFALPTAFEPTSFQQLRALVRAGHISLSWEGLDLGAFAVPSGATQVGLWADGPAHFELVRVTALPM
jgi:arabinan endo-1,5-alpha-L-arabinosidase